MTTLRDWLDRLEEFDPDDWGEVVKLRATSSEAALDTDLEAEITFRTEAGIVDRGMATIHAKKGHLHPYRSLIDLFPLLSYQHPVTAKAAQ